MLHQTLHWVKLGLSFRCSIKLHLSFVAQAGVVHTTSWRDVQIQGNFMGSYRDFSLLMLNGLFLEQYFSFYVASADWLRPVMSWGFLFRKYRGFQFPLDCDLKLPHSIVVLGNTTN